MKQNLMATAWQTQQGISRAVSTLLFQPWQRKLAEVVYLLFCITGFGRMVGRKAEKCQHGLNAPSCETLSLFKNQKSRESAPVNKPFNRERII